MQQRVNISRVYMEFIMEAKNNIKIEGDAFEKIKAKVAAKKAAALEASLED